MRPFIADVNIIKNTITIVPTYNNPAFSPVKTINSLTKEESISE